MIARISKFRSGEGHSYTDAFEQCRSMKHYFQPRAGTDAGTMRIYSPIAGEVSDVREESAGAQIHIASREFTAFRVILFHVRLAGAIGRGTLVEAGQPIGTHIGHQTMSDVAVAVNTPQGFRLVSWFEALDEATSAPYRALGLNARSDAIISRAERDARPLACSGEAFADKGMLDNWVTLRTR